MYKNVVQVDIGTVFEMSMSGCVMFFNLWERVDI